MDSGPQALGTILVVDDESVVRNLCATILTTAGYKVLTAEDGYGALGLCKAEETPVDLALVDIRMPKMSGPELIELLDCVVPLNLGIRFILMSGYTDPEALDQANGNQRHCSFLQKPFKPSDLLEAVRRELGTAERRARLG